MKKAAFIERDALLNLATKQGQQKTPTTWEEFRVNKQAVDSLQRLRNAGYLLIVTTNQPEISEGILSRRELDRMHDLLRATFPLDDILFCPHEAEDDCPCRKPRAGMFHEAAFKHHLLLGLSVVISPRWEDAQVARIIGSTAFLIESPWLGSTDHQFALRNLDAAVDKLLERERPHCHVA
jgi:D-glycero-D-manno-heptose 1,7-bisphosphate phosphatase